MKNIFLCCSLLLLYHLSFAAEAYSLCSQSQQTQLLQKYNLKQSPDSEDNDNYISCLNLDSKQQKVALAISRLTSTPPHNEDDVLKTFNLTLYLINPTLSQPMSHTVIEKNIESDALEFTGIEFDTHRFSNLTNQDVLGIRLSHSVYGGIKVQEDRLLLLQLEHKQKIRKILDIMTNDSSGIQIGCGGVFSAVDRILISNPQTHFGLQDIRIQATKMINTVDRESCKSQKQIIKKRYKIQFNGTYYVISDDGLVHEAL